MDNREANNNPHPPHCTCVTCVNKRLGIATKRTIHRSSSHSTNSSDGGIIVILVIIAIIGGIIYGIVNYHDVAWNWLVTTYASISESNKANIPATPIITAIPNNPPLTANQPTQTNLAKSTPTNSSNLTWTSPNGTLYTQYPDGSVVITPPSGEETSAPLVITPTQTPLSTITSSNQTPITDKIKDAINHFALWDTDVNNYATIFNEYRQSKGCQPLVFTEDLNRIAILALLQKGSN